MSGSGGIEFLTGITAIACGALHTIALKGDGTVWTWGNNGVGQLGDGTETDRLTPLQVLGTGGVGFLTGITAIAGGVFYTIAIKEDGTVWTWGDNSFGQLGNGTDIEGRTPLQVLGLGGVGFLTGIVAIAAGGSHTVALKGDRTVWAWGNNGNGQLGDGTTTGRLTPVRVLLP